MPKIFAYLGKHTLGDFLMEALFIAAVRERFNDAELFVYYVDNRPYKADIVSCIWNARAILRMPPGGDVLPIELFDAQARSSVVNIPEISVTGVVDADIIITGNAFLEPMLNTLALPTLRIPEKRVGASDQALIELGLDPTRWIATVYWKEAGYEHRGPNPVREIADPGPYIAAIRHIVEDLGGQVVRLGHPTDIVLPQLSGFIDLAKVKDSH